MLVLFSRQPNPCTVNLVVFDGGSVADDCPCLDGVPRVLLPKNVVCPEVWLFARSWTAMFSLSLSGACSARGCLGVFSGLATIDFFPGASAAPPLY